MLTSSAVAAYVPEFDRGCAIANDFYADSGNPANNSQGDSSVVRAEFAAIEAAFDKLPALTGNGDKTCVINAGETAITVKTAAEMRTLLALVIGTNVQAYDDTLQSLSALGTAADKLAYTTSLDTWAETPLTAAARALLDDANSAAMLATLGAAADSGVVHNTGNETIAGNKTLSGNTTLGTAVISSAGLMTAGEIPKGRTDRTEQSGTATGVNVIGIATTLVTLDLGTVVAGDIIDFAGEALMLKGATAGITSMQVAQNTGSGAATIYGGRNDVPDAVSGSLYRTISGHCVVSMGGTFSLRLYGISTGSDSTANSIEFYARVIRGS